MCRQRPHTEPAPQAAATSLVERAPPSMACWTVLLVTPMQRQTYIVILVVAAGYGPVLAWLGTSMVCSKRPTNRGG